MSIKRTSSTFVHTIDRLSSSTSATQSLKRKKTIQLSLPVDLYITYWLSPSRSSRPSSSCQGGREPQEPCMPLYKQPQIRLSTQNWLGILHFRSKCLYINVGATIPPESRMYIMCATKTLPEKRLFHQHQNWRLESFLPVVKPPELIYVLCRSYNNGESCGQDPVCAIDCRSVADEVVSCC